jgi:hypothetical protein
MNWITVVKKHMKLAAVRKRDPNREKGNINKPGVRCKYSNKIYKSVGSWFLYFQKSNSFYFALFF